MINSKLYSVAIILLLSLLTYTLFTENPVNKSIQATELKGQKIVQDELCDAVLEKNLGLESIYDELALFDKDDRIEPTEEQSETTSLSTISKSSGKLGVIGKKEHNDSDNPEDNVFKINIKQSINLKHKYTLNYKVQGVNGAQSTRKSINENPVFGGFLVKNGTDWNEVEEVLDARMLKKGVNTIRFNGSAVTNQYKIKEVSITTMQYQFPKDYFAVTPDKIEYVKDGKAYLRGFSYNEKISRVHIGQQSFPVVDGRFEGYINISENAIEASKVELTYFVDGKVYTKEILIAEDLKTADDRLPIESLIISKTTPLKTYQNIEYHTEGIELIISDDLDVSETIIVSKARSIDVAPLGPGMVNVTAGKTTFRCQPHGKQFSEPIVIKIPYEEELIPKGYSYKDIQTLYFDELAAQWKAVQIDSIDVENQIVHAITDHFSDYINGIIQVPESASTSEFTPTMMSDVKAAQPMANLNIMGAPSASQRGTANTSFPIEIPSGRLGMQPQVALNYSSDGGSSWVGYGWSLSMPAISIDTRWGTPLFDPERETEIYTMNGQQLVHDDGFMPNRHQMVEEACIPSNKMRDESPNPAVFYERKLGSFSKIERHGTSPLDYYWKVTSSNGMISWYGYPEYSEGEDIIKNSKGISYWPLVRTEDVHGNHIRYDYVNDNNTLYINKITYTHSTDGSLGKYEVSFIMHNAVFGTRLDKVVNGRLGVKQSEGRLLYKIEVSYNDEDNGSELIRSYQMGYQETRELEEGDVDCSEGIGRFHKMLLSSITDIAGEESASAGLRHDFFYYDDTKNGLFGEEVIIDLPCDDPLPCDDDADPDGDGIPNCHDNCDYVWNPLQNNDCEPETDPCGPFDYDNDGINDGCDLCPEDDMASQTDSDNDGVGNDCDNCPIEANGNQTNSDDDSFGNVCDNCPFIGNEDQADEDEDGLGDACDPCDIDVTPNLTDPDQDDHYGLCDNCPDNYNPDQADYDGDGIGDECDNCMYEPNPDQLDDDNDGAGNVCDIEVITGDPCVDNGIFIHGTGLDEQPYLGEYIVPNGLNSLTIVLAPLQVPETFKILKNGTTIISTGSISAGNNSNCQSINIDLTDELYEDGDPLIGLLTGEGIRQNSSKAEFTINTAENDIITFIVGHPACTSGSGWFVFVTCTDGAGIMPTNNDFNFDHLFSTEWQDQKHNKVKSEYTVYKVSFSDTDLLEYSYEDLQGKKVEKIFTELEAGMTTSFVAKNESVSVESKNGKYSIFPLRTFYNRQQKQELKRRLLPQSTQNETKVTDKEIVSKKIKNNKGDENDGVAASKILEDCGFTTSVDIISTNLPQSNQTTAALGTSKSVSSSFGGSIGAGVSIGTPFTFLKGNLASAQAAFGGSFGYSYSLVANEDIDGDGFKDLILRHNEGHFRYRKHIVTRTIGADGQEEIEHTYGDLVDLKFGNGIDPDKFEIGFSETLTIDEPDVTATVALGPFGVHFGTNNSTTYTSNPIFFTDGNGDGLLDISYFGVVYFNYIDDNGVPTFVPSSEPTENMILADYTVDPQDFIPAEFAELTAKFPDYDAVKVWRAPADGNIIINNLGTVSTETAKISIETDVNKFYRRADQIPEGTCRIASGDISDIVSLGSINDLSGEGNLACQSIMGDVDPCVADYDEDGIPDCSDPCPMSVECNPCQEYLNIVQDVEGGITSEKAAEIELTASNTIKNSNGAIYTAGQGILLDQGFTTEPNAHLLAYLSPCNQGTGDDSEDDSGGDSDDPPLTSSLRVQKGQNIYFRLHSTEPYEEAHWDPEIIYTDVLGLPIDAEELIDPDNLPYYKNKYSEDFNTTGSSPRIIPSYSEDGAEVTISWPELEVGGLSDDVTFEIKRIVTTQKVKQLTGSSTKVLVDEYEEELLLHVDIPAGEAMPIEDLQSQSGISSQAIFVQGTIPDDIQSLNVDDIVGDIFTSFEFRIRCKSNIDWSSISWNPLLEYTYVETTSLEEEEYEEDFTITNSFYPNVIKDIYATYSPEFDMNSEPDAAYNNVRLYPDELTNVMFFTFNKELLAGLACPTFDDPGDGIQYDENEDWCTGALTAVIKQNGVAIGHQLIELDGSGLPILTPSSIEIPIINDSDKSITVELYGDGQFLTNQALDHIASIPFGNQNIADYTGFIGTSSDGFGPENSNVRKLTKREVNLYTKSNDLYGPMYRNWGQFFYNPAADLDSETPEDGFGKLINTTSKIETADLDQSDFDDLLAVVDGLADQGGIEPDDLTDPDEFDFEENNITDKVDEINAKFNVNRIPFVGAFPEKQKIDDANGLAFVEKWRGLSTSNFAGRNSSRAVNLVISVKETIREIEYPEPLLGESDKGATSIPRYSVSSNESKSLPSFMMNTSGSKSKSDANNLTDYRDLNGDRYPDIVSTQNFVMSNPMGGLHDPDDLEEIGIGEGFGSLGLSNTRGKGIGASGEKGYPLQSNGNSSTSNNSPDATVGISFSANVSVGSTKSNVSWLDINGDGLSDRLTKITENDVNGLPVTVGQKVDLNFGEGPLEDMAPDLVGAKLPINSMNKGFSFGGGFSFSHGESIQLSMSYGKSKSGSLGQYIDINGDGLPDHVYSEKAFSDLDGIPIVNVEDLLNVEYNTGTKFVSDDPSVSVVDGLSLKNSSVAIQYSNNLGVSKSGFIPIPIPFVVIYIKIPQVGIHGSIKNTSYNTSRKSIEDYDGDGYPDFLRHANNTLYVRHSQIKRTNKLKKIVTPIGAEYTLDYEVVPPSYDCPSAKWVMNKVKVVDTKNLNQIALGNTEEAAGPTEAEGPGEHTTYYKYSKPHHDRREREFYGFKGLRTIEMDALDDDIQSDIANFEGHIFSQSIQQFHNQSYYLNGRPTETYTVEGSVPLHPDGSPIFPLPTAQMYSKVVNSYEVRDKIMDSDAWKVDWSEEGKLEKDYDVGGTLGLGAAYCFLDSTINEMYEDGVGPLQLIQAFSYDEWGRVKNMDHNSGEYNSEIIYYPHGEAYANYNIISIPEEILVYEGVNPLRRRWVTSIDGKGRPTEVATFFGPVAAAYTTLVYDDNNNGDALGNLSSLTSPYNDLGHRLTTSYEYDDDVKTYPIEISSELSSSSEVFTSSNTYDFHFGVPKSTTDIHGNTTTYVYDHRGRNTNVKGPKEDDYTIKFTYEPLGIDGGKGYATTEHYNYFDPENPIETVTIANGFGQAIQVKKDITVYDPVAETYDDMMSISGPVITDIHGRPVKQFLPTSGDYSVDFVSDVSDYSSTTTYEDITKRPHISYDPAGNPTEITYSLEGDYQVTEIKMKQNNDDNMPTVYVESKEYKDVNGRVEKTVQLTNTGDITTLFTFDGIGQLKSYQADDGTSTTYEYDYAGRTTQRIHPDAGEENYTYDNLGNLLSKSSGLGTLTSTYDELGRILSLEHPAYENGIENINNVTYTYYDQVAGELNNNSGRLKRIDEATGFRTYEYGNLGEVEKESRVIATPTPKRPIYRFDTEYKYDSWGRLKTLKYPDEEELSYDYDGGGNLKSISGDHDYVTEIGYDFFEQKIYCAYGNGTSNSYSYEDDLRRRNTLQVKLDNGNNILDNTYSYDAIGNILTLENVADVQNDMGGNYTHNYTYDKLNRLTSAVGNWNEFIGPPGSGNGNGGNNAEYFTSMSYNDSKLGRISNKNYVVSHDGIIDLDQSTDGPDNIYAYEDLSHPQRVTGVGHAPAFSVISYDANGNQVSNFNGLNPINSNMFYNVDNLMRGVKKDNYLIQHYMYDADGQRVLKAKGDITTAGTDGDNTTSAVLNPYTIYPSGHITVSASGRYTKHYYSGSERINSRLSGINTIFLSSEDMSELISAQIDGELSQLQADINVDDLTPIGLDLPNDDCSQYDPVTEAEQYKQCLCEFDPNNCPEDVLYFFHSDQLGSSSVITDAEGDVYQFLLYSPWGNTFVEQKAAQFSTPYQFNGKELDQETGLYNYGARYYDPSLSVWMGVDPLADAPANISWSPYTYVWNNPINAIDPDGRHGEWIKDEDENGNIVYTAEQGDSAQSLEDQHGVPFEVGNTIIQNFFGKNKDNGTPEGRSNIHPGDKIGLYVLNMESTQTDESGGGILGWFKDLFNDNSSNTGGFAIFAKGSRSGWDLDGRPVGSDGKVSAINISDMLTPGGGNSGKFLSSKVRLQFLTWEYNFVNSGVTALKAFGAMPYGRTKSTLPTLGDSIICPSCNQLQDSSHIDQINGAGTYSRKKDRR